MEQARQPAFNPAARLPSLGGTDPGRGVIEIGPGLVLGVLVATFHTALYVFLRNRMERHVVAAWVVAIVGALAGNALGQRVGLDPLRLGDFDALWASVGAWAGIGLVALLSLLVPPRATR